MTDDQFNETLRGVFVRVFDLGAEDVTDDLRRGRHERWDSLGHLMLVEALREAFRVDLSLEHALDMETVADVKRIVRSMLKAEPA